MCAECATSRHGSPVVARPLRPRHWSISRKSGHRFSEKEMRHHRAQGGQTHDYQSYQILVAGSECALSLWPDDGNRVKNTKTVTTEPNEQGSVRQLKRSRLRARCCLRK